MNVFENFEVADKQIVKNDWIEWTHPGIPNKQSFYTGWMIYPNGIIKNTTPFGGWIKWKNIML